MSRTIVDVTQLAHWQGKITGIPRVMDELSRRFWRQKDKQVVFVSWVKDLQDFCEVDFEQTIIKRNGIAYKRSGDVKSETQTANVAVPTRKSLLKRVAKKGLKVAGRISPGMSERLESHARQLHMQDHKRAEFHKDDVLIIPWGEWWDPTFGEYLVRAHKEKGVRIVQIIHDVATTVWPQFYEQVEVTTADYNTKIVPIADLVLCVSQNTKKELIDWLKQQKLHVPKVEVFRLGDSLDVAKSEKPDDSAFMTAKLKGGDYILCVGTIEAKKNHALFYYAYKLAKARGVALPKVVIVGRRGWGTENIYDIMQNDPEVGEQFVFLHNASDEHLSWLYDHCMFTVLPSFHEGWGIPIAESLGRGAPCLCSNTSSMVEIAEGIVGHFSPYSSDECLAAITDWLDPKRLQAARERTKRYKPTSWDDSFKQVNTYMEQL